MRTESRLGTAGFCLSLVPWTIMGVMEWLQPG